MLTTEPSGKFWARPRPFAAAQGEKPSLLGWAGVPLQFLKSQHVSQGCRGHFTLLWRVSALCLLWGRVLDLCRGVLERSVEVGGCCVLACLAVTVGVGPQLVQAKFLGNHDWQSCKV